MSNYAEHMLSLYLYSVLVSMAQPPVVLLPHELGVN
jgi:hypothetical protein